MRRPVASRRVFRLDDAFSGTVEELADVEVSDAPNVVAAEEADHDRPYGSTAEQKADLHLLDSDQLVEKSLKERTRNYITN